MERLTATVNSTNSPQMGSRCDVMTEVIVDAEMLTKLSGLSEPLVFCDPQGRVLGRFVPGNLTDDLEPGVLLEELQQRCETFQAKPLADLLARWEKGE